MKPIPEESYISMDTVKYERIPFYVDVPEAVSAENIEAMAEWCDGEIRTEGNGPNARRYISVKVQMPLKERQTKAFYGDRILFAGNGFKVYTPKAFAKSFRKVRQLSKAEAQRAGIKPPIEGKKKARGIPQQMRPKQTFFEEKHEVDEIVEKANEQVPPMEVTPGYGEVAVDDESNSFSDLTHPVEKTVQEEQEAFGMEAERILAEIENSEKDS